MRRTVRAVVDLAGGLALAGAAFLGVRTLLQSRTLVFLYLPLIGLVAFALGAWRRPASRPGGWIAVVLINLPLALLAWYASVRSRSLLLLPVLGVAFSVLGLAAAGAWKIRWRWVLPVLVAASGALVAATPRFTDSLTVRSEVSEAPVPFRVSLVGGGAASHQDLRGRVVVLAFWATWCVPCHRELPELERVYERFENDPRVAVFAVDFGPGDTPDARGDTPEAAAEFFRRFGYRIPLAHDADGSLCRVLSAQGLPYLLVLDGEGRVRYRHSGFVGAENFADRVTETIQKLLPEARS